jgi:hypothetical protein
LKNIGYIFICVCFIQQAVGQHYIEKSVETSSKNIEIYLNDIDNLLLESTPDNIVSVKLKEAQVAQLSSINFSHEKNGFVIRALEKFTSQDQFNKFCVEQPALLLYVITVPNHSNVSLKIGKGNLFINNFEGNLNAEVDTGEVLLNNIIGDVSLFIIDGVVRSKIQKAALNIKTNLGEVISTLPLKTKLQNPKMIRGVYKSKSQMLTIKAIKANIYLDAVKD